MNLFVEAAGWVAAVLILIAYLMVSTGRLSGRSALFQWLNVGGALGFIINSGAHQAWPSAVLNVIWAGIGIVTLLQIRNGSQR